MYIYICMYVILSYSKIDHSVYMSGVVLICIVIIVTTIVSIIISIIMFIIIISSSSSITHYMYVYIYIYIFIMRSSGRCTLPAARTTRRISTITNVRR